MRKYDGHAPSGPLSRIYQMLLSSLTVSVSRLSLVQYLSDLLAVDLLGVHTAQIVQQGGEPRLVHPLAGRDERQVG